MLVLSRKTGERIRIGDNVTITVVRITGGGVRLGIEAPAELPVVREELFLEMQSEEGDCTSPNPVSVPKPIRRTPNPR